MDKRSPKGRGFGSRSGEPRPLRASGGYEKRGPRRDDRDRSHAKSKYALSSPLQMAPERIDTLEQAFRAFWKDLFTSSVHLDAALSKRPPTAKAALALLVPLFLRNPGALCEGLGIGTAVDEPWCLSPEGLAQWKPAYQAIGRFIELRKSGLPFPGFEVTAQAEDYPPFMLKEWEKEWGHEVATRLIEVLGKEPPLSLRAAMKVGADGLIQALKQQGDIPVRVEKSKLAPLGVVLSGFAYVLKTELFAQGAFEIQDEGSQFMALFALWPELFAKRLQKVPGPTGQKFTPPQIPAKAPAWTVIDACAGAGGKALALADALSGKGRVYAYDTSGGKLMALRKRAKRAGYNNIQTVALEEGKEAETVGKFRRRADVVLVDAPCSGWGVLRRNPDIKWRQYRSATPEEAAQKMPEIQTRILDTYSDLVAPGGRLVYGVCTFRKAETLEVVDCFLESHPDFTRAEGGYLGPDSSDGFFMQAFTRKKGGA